MFLIFSGQFEFEICESEGFLGEDFVEDWDETESDDQNA